MRTTPGTSNTTDSGAPGPEGRLSDAAQSRRAAVGAVLTTVGALWVFGARGQSAAAASPPANGDTCALFDHSHAGWNGLLQRYVKAGVVDYAGLVKTGRAELDAYLASLEGVCRGHLDQWTREQKLAFWINAYNAYTVKLILEHYPLESIRKIGFLPGAAFREGFIPLDGKKLSLNDLEHGILRKQFTEPRIHFAIVCASKSCPALRSEAYRAADLEAQLDDAARGFVQDRSKNRLERAKKTLYLSSIFSWFREDFERGARTLPAFVARYADADTAAAISSTELQVEFLSYDWSLNGR